jgi:hypothetical protein
VNVRYLVVIVGSAAVRSVKNYMCELPNSVFLTAISLSLKFKDRNAINYDLKHDSCKIIYNSVNGYSLMKYAECSSKRDNISGGLTAVIYTDTLQAVLMIGGALSLMAKGWLPICKSLQLTGLLVMRLS